MYKPRKNLTVNKDVLIDTKQFLFQAKKFREIMIALIHWYRLNTTKD